MMIFASARWRLTAWYLLILASIIIAFSVALYYVSKTSIERANERQVTLFREALPDIQIINVNQAAINEELLVLRRQLLIIDSVLILLAGILSYLLAGQTLEPIRRMVEQQQAFATNASHELKTPLAVMRADLDVTLKKPRPASEYRQTLRRLSTEVERLSALAANLLLIAGAKEGFGHGVAVVALDRVAAQSAQAFRPSADEKKLVITETLEPVRILADQFQMRQLADILIDNAVKYTPKGGIITVVTALRASEVELSVSDTGRGIPRNAQQRIFERFFRAVRPAPNIPGAGLGLAIAKAIVESHHGTLKYEPNRPKGSRFIARFPKTSEGS